MKAAARIVRDRGSVRFALPVHTTQEIIEHPKAVAVPGSARHALGLIEWQGSRIPMIDVPVRLGAAAPRTQPPRYALVVALQESPGAAVEHGALAMDELPEPAQVDDAAACDIPPSAAWQRIAIACFMHQGVPVPIVDTAKLLNAAHL